MRGWASASASARGGEALTALGTLRQVRRHAADEYAQKICALCCSGWQYNPPRPGAPGPGAGHLSQRAGLGGVCRPHRGRVGLAGLDGQHKEAGRQAAGVGGRAGAHVAARAARGMQAGTCEAMLALPWGTCTHARGLPRHLKASWPPLSARRPDSEACSRDR